jgi:DNA helicase-2/ATP-dependent DNA helicase PcrA
MAWDDDLFERQCDAARHSGTHARLLAGPGTGKTLTLTRRLVKLVTEDGVPPEDTLAVAFTRINAHDLRTSVAEELAQYGVSMPRISTLHSYALRQLLRNYRLITSLPQPLRIADDFEEKNIIRADIGQTLGLNDRQMRERFAELSSDWQSLAVEDPGYQPADPHFMAAWQQHRKVYGYTLRSELVWQLKHAVEENPDSFDLEGDIQQLLVDEYQDLNKCDLAVIWILAERGAEVFCAGDDDQSIYGFRRAHPAGIRRFLDEYEPSTPLGLDICLRCDRAIIAVGQYVANLDLDPRRLEKPLNPREDAGDGEVHLLRFPNQYEEARGVASICKYLTEIEGYAPDDILVLLRSDHQRRYSSVLESAIRHRTGLETSVRAERGGPMDESPGRHLLCLMRLSVNDCDDLSWRTIFQFVGRSNQIGPQTVSYIYDYADENGLRFHQVLQRIEQNPQLISRGGFVQQEMAAIHELTAQLADLAGEEPPDVQDEAERARDREELLERLVGFAEIIISSQEDRQVVLAHVRKVAERGNIATFDQLLNTLVGPEDTLDQELEPRKINILTMHRAKGLSAKAVIIVAAEEQLIPGDATGEALDDQRRLLYVSLTRAKHRLYVTYCNKRGGQQKHSGSDPGNPRRTLTPFLRGAMPVESGAEYLASLSARR